MSGDAVAAVRAGRQRLGLEIVGALVGAGACALGVLGLYEAFVRRAAGQRIDQTALQGARVLRGRVIDVVLPGLGLISAVGIITAGTIVCVIAIVRRRLDLAAAALTIIAGSIVTSQIAKRLLFDRPFLGIETEAHNSLPSGHTTVVASIAAALVVVAPARWRAAATVIGAASTAVTGVATMAAAWHRPSDVVAAILVALGWTLAVVAAIAWASRGRPRAHAASTGPTGVLLATLGLVALVPMAWALWRTAALTSIPHGRGDLLIAYGGGACAVLAASCLGFAIIGMCAGLIGSGRPVAQR